MVNESEFPSSHGKPSSRRRFILGLGAAGLALGLADYTFLRSSAAGKIAVPAAGGSLGSLKLAHRASQAFGTETSIVVLHESLAVAERALDDAFSVIARVEKVMSIYLPQSQVSRLNAEAVLHSPDPLLVQILEHSREMSEQSGGAFDITVQPLWTLYASAQTEGKLPSDVSVAETVQHVDWRGVSVSAQEVRLQNGAMSITLNGIAQGFAADRAMDALKSHGVHHALVNAGEISSLGYKESGEPWVVGIDHPRNKDVYIGLVQLDGRCISTSGDYETAFTPDFRKNHIFDPATGDSPTAFSSVTVVAPDATTADAMSTAIFVLGPERGLALAAKYPGTDVLLVMKNQQLLATPSFPWRSAGTDKPQSIPS